VKWAPGGPITIADESLPRDALLARVATAAEAWRQSEAVAVVAHPSLGAAVTILAAIEAGVPVIPVSPDAGPREREHVLVDSGARVLVDGEVVTDLRPTGPPPDREAALVLYTSGTTGAPKGVPITRSAIIHCLGGLAEAWDWTPDDLVVHGLPLHHVHGLVLGVLGPLLVGSGLRHTGRPTPSAYAAAVGSLYFAVPTIWSRIARDADAARALAGARLLVSGSAALPAPVFDALSALSGHAPIERYGMTETLITLSARADEPARRGWVGRALPGIESRIVSDEAQPLPIGDIGHLHVRGVTVFDGYLNRPDATAEGLDEDGWFRTGDIAESDDEGRHRIVGRASTDLIKSGGYRIGAGEVEDALLAHASVHEAAVVGVPDDDLGQRVVAFVVADGVDEATLVTHVSTTLSAHKRPRAVVFVDSLPRNAMGKVDKTALLP
jgi:fatty acid CoA ligase FadD36